MGAKGKFKTGLLLKNKMIASIRGQDVFECSNDG